MGNLWSQQLLRNYTSLHVLTANGAQCVLGPVIHQWADIAQKCFGVNLFPTHCTVFSEIICQEYITITCKSTDIQQYQLLKLKWYILPWQEKII